MFDFILPIYIMIMYNKKGDVSSEIKYIIRGFRYQAPLLYFLFVWSWFHKILKQMITDTRCQQDGVQTLSRYDSTRTITSHVHIKSNGHTKLVTNTMEMDKAGPSTLAVSTPGYLPLCEQCCQLRLYKQKRVFPHLTTPPPSSLT